MRVLIFSKIFPRFKKNFAKYYHKYTQAFMQITHYSCRTSMKLEFFRQILEKYGVLTGYGCYCSVTTISSEHSKGETKPVQSVKYLLMF